MTAKPEPATAESQNVCPKCGAEVAPPRGDFACGSYEMGSDDRFVQSDNCRARQLARENAELRQRLEAADRESARYRQSHIDVCFELSEAQSVLSCVHEAVCSYLCQSIWKTGLPQQHSTECQRIRAAIAKEKS